MQIQYNSQCGQDKYLNEKIFKNKKKGVFVDIGANDGVTISNTLFFEQKLQWSGMCVEPIPEVFNKLKNNRTSININGCASNATVKDKFISVHGYGEMLSGLKSQYDERHLKRIYATLESNGGYIEEIDIQCYDINQLFYDNKILEIDFISLDTEGGELNILKAINFQNVFIKVIVVENNYNSPDISIFLMSKGFVLIKKLDADEIYLNKNHFNIFRRLMLKYAR